MRRDSRKGAYTQRFGEFERQRVAGGGGVERGARGEQVAERVVEVREREIGRRGARSGGQQRVAVDAQIGERARVEQQRAVARRRVDVARQQRARVQARGAGRLRAPLGQQHQIVRYQQMYNHMCERVSTEPIE